MLAQIITFKIDLKQNILGLECNTNFREFIANTYVE